MGVGAFHCCPSTTKTITRAAAFVAFWWPFLGVNKAISKWACNATSTIYWWSCISCRNVIRLCVTQMDLTENEIEFLGTLHLCNLPLTGYGPLEIAVSSSVSSCSPIIFPITISSMMSYLGLPFAHAGHCAYPLWYVPSSLNLVHEEEPFLL